MPWRASFSLIISLDSIQLTTWPIQLFNKFWNESQEVSLYTMGLVVIMKVITIFVQHKSVSMLILTTQITVLMRYCRDILYRRKKSGPWPKWQNKHYLSPLGEHPQSTEYVMPPFLLYLLIVCCEWIAILGTIND